MSAAFPPRSLGAPSSRLIARRENSAAALRSLAGSAGGSRAGNWLDRAGRSGHDEALWICSGG
jgi:hypothetical protein